MAVSKAQQRATNKYISKAYDRINLTLPKGQKEVVQAHATAHGESVNGFIGRAIMEAMERDGGGTVAHSGPQEAAGAPAETGTVSLPSDSLEAAQQAAERTGETVAAFVARAVADQEKRDNTVFKLGINPATGSKLKEET